MRILLVTDAYPPEIRSASHLMIELAEELSARGHSVTVLTSWPKYNLDETDAQRTFREFENERGIDVVRVRTLPHHNVNFVVRGLAQITMPRLFLRALRRHNNENFDAVLVYSPPLPLAKVGATLRRQTGARFILNIQDIFPQNAIDLGVLRNRLLITWFERMERRAYADADVVTVHSPGNRAFLMQSGKLKDPTKLRILHNWIDVGSIRTQPSSQRFREMWGLTGKFVFLFAGVMGPSQYLETVLSVAEALKDESDLVFLIVGDGMEKPRLQNLAQERGLKNVVFKPFVSKAAYSQLVNEVDVGMVTLSPRNRTPVVPGKILGYMAAAKPVLAFLNRESDGHELVAEAGCGVSVHSDAPMKEIVDATRSLLARRNDLETLGSNGYSYVVEHFDKSVCVDTLELYLSH